MKNHACAWLVIITILSACTCGVRPACNGPTQISVLTGVHDDPACRKLSSRGVLIYEASKFLTELHNNKSNGLQIELAVMDTCGSIAGSMKAAMKALVRADVNCLQPPHYLGIIGPDTMTNAEAVQKVASVLRVPQIVRKASNSPFLHHLPKESDEYIVRAILKAIDALNWKTFTLAIQNDENNDDDDVQNIAKKLTMEAIAKGFCVLIHDDEQNDFSSNIVHIGKPDIRFFAGSVNATILVVSEGNLEPYLNRINTNNSVLLLEDARKDFDDLELRVKNSRWWAEEGSGRYDSEELRDIRWLQDAVEVYVNAIENLCKKKKCKNQVNPADWNIALTNALTRQNTEAQSAVKVMEISIKVKNSKLAILGKIKVYNNKANLHWGDAKTDNDDDNDDSLATYDDDFEIIPSSFKKLISKGKETRSGCATSTKEIGNSITDDEDEAARVFVSEMDETEWWTMVITVSGVGIAMFTVGILAVYVVYTNIRGPKAKNKKTLERVHSLRSMGSERRPATITRVMRGPQRRDSNRSITSNVSEKSV